MWSVEGRSVPGSYKHIWITVTALVDQTDAEEDYAVVEVGRAPVLPEYVWGPEELEEASATMPNSALLTLGAIIVTAI